MNRKWKKGLRITLIAIFSLLFLLLSGIAIIINFVFTPEKLTPVVLKTANQALDAKLDMKSVELTFFSTFPHFGLKLTEVRWYRKRLTIHYGKRPTRCSLSGNACWWLIRWII